MGGDLNLKKSWHPVLMSNQKRVYEEEQKALQERKRTQERVKELQQERQIEELQQMQEAAGGPRRQTRVDWMYSGPSAGQTGTTEEMEGYLLGKRRIDPLIKGTEHKKLEKGAEESSFMALQNANTARDTASKIREDPMLAIKKQEQAAYEALMNDPVRRRLLLKAAGQDVPSEKKDKESRRHKHRHHHHRSHRDSRDEDEDRHEKRSSHRDDRDRDYRRRNYHDDRRRRANSSSISRSPSPDRNTRRRTPSPYNSRQRFPSPYDSKWRSRSPSPYRSRINRSPSPKRPRQYSRSPPPRRLNHSKSFPASNPRPKPAMSDADKAARLAAMQSSASELDTSRTERLKALEEQERVEREKDEKARERNAKLGGKGDFVHGLNRQAGEIGIGERMKRGRGGLEKVGDGE